MYNVLDVRYTEQNSYHTTDACTDMDTGVIDDMYSMGAVCEPIRQMAVCVGWCCIYGEGGRGEEEEELVSDWQSIPLAGFPLVHQQC